MMGRYPNKGIIASGAGSRLVNSFFEGCLIYLEDDTKYNYLEIFPDAKVVDRDMKQLSVDVGVKKRFPSLTCVSAGANVIGSTEASSCLYLDDLIESHELALNYDRLDKLWDSVASDLLGRRTKGCPIVVCGTVYSTRDVISRLKEMSEKLGWRSKIIAVPALDENDESNFEFEFGLGFDTKHYRNERELVPESTWAAEFQQEPFELKERTFAPNELNYYDELPNERPDAVICCVDIAHGGGDYSSAPVAYLYGSNVYIEDVMFNNKASDVTIPLLCELLIKHRPNKTRFESNNGGDFYGVMVKDKLKELDPKLRFPFDYKTSTANKITRILVSSDNIKQNFYFRKDLSEKVGTPYYDFMKQIYSFSPVAKNKHDDAIDSVSLLENMVLEYTVPKGRMMFLSREQIGF